MVEDMRSIYAIQLAEDHFKGFLDSGGRPLKEIERLGRVNLFVGSNSCGKSRFLRRLARIQDHVVKYDESSLAAARRAFRDALDRIATELHGHMDQLTRMDRGKVMALHDKFPEWLRLGHDHFKQLRETLSALSASDQWNVKGRAKDALEIIQALPSETFDPPGRHYIPVLRGLRSLSTPTDQEGGQAYDYYRARTVRDYFSADGVSADANAPAVFTGVTLYQETRRLLLGLTADRQRISDYQRFLGREFFDGQEVILVPHDRSDVLYVKIGNESDRPIYELGDGIQQAIMLSFLPFVSTDPAFFFVEEPELHLHPGLQRKVLNFYARAERGRRHHYFVTTHSNHLLDMTIDFKGVSVFNFRKRLKPAAGPLGEREPEFIVQAMDGRDESVLVDLGVKNSSVFLVNATVWVEGITDRLYLRHMIDLFQRHAAKMDPAFVSVQEDVHFAIIEYGGANVTHFFIDEEARPSITLARVCGKVFLLIDSDGASKAGRKERLASRLGSHFAITPGREIENMLPLRVIYAVVSDYEIGNGGAAPVLPKAPVSHKEIPLGLYIHEHMLPTGPKRRGGYKAESGTLKDKVNFCERALAHLTSFDELDDQVKQMVQRIHAFVVSQNS